MAQKGPKTEVIVSLRLSGKPLRQIARETGLSHEMVRQRLKKAAAQMGAKEAEKLAVNGTRAAHTNISSMVARQKVVDAFLEELNRSHTPKGVLKKAAARIGFRDPTSITHHLVHAGINYRGEIQRRRLALAIRVEGTMHLPRKTTARQLRIPIHTLDDYRSLVKKRRHLTGALELANSPEAEKWWDLKVPAVPSGPGINGRINLTMRNKTVQKDLKLFEDSIKAARRKLASQHPESRGGESHNLAAFVKATKTLKALRDAHKRYKERETKFRQKYSLPIHEMLK